MTRQPAVQRDAGAAPLRTADFATTADLLAAAAEVHAHRDAYVDQDGTRLSFAAWRDRATSVAALLSRRGVGKGDVVALMMPSGIDYAVCYAAVALLGGITTGLNTRYGVHEVTGVLAKAGPRLVIRDPEAGVPEVPPGIEVITASEVVRASLAAPVAPVPPVELDRSDPVTIIFTSGTTGLPKGAVFDGDNLAAFADAAGVLSAPYARRLTSTPFPHAGYMAKLWDQLIWGMAMVASPTPWSARRMFETLRDERVTVGGGVPTQWAKLLEEPGVSRESLPHLQIGIVATAPASPQLIEQTTARLGVPLVVRYAMTESPTICGTDPGDPADVLFRTVGRPQAGMSVKVTDADGEALPVGEVGTVRIKGPCVMRGYWREPELSRGAFDADGYLVSGDLGRLTPAGDLQLVGRRGDLYIRGGFNIHPVEVEQVLTEHPAVRAAAVVGHAAPVIGEIGVAFVVAADPRHPPTLDELRAWTRGRIADYKAPDRLVLVEELPLTAMSKLDRVQLRSLLTDGAHEGQLNPT